MCHQFQLIDSWLHVVLFWPADSARQANLISDRPYALYSKYFGDYATLHNHVIRDSLSPYKY